MKIELFALIWYFSVYKTNIREKLPSFVSAKRRTLQENDEMYFFFIKMTASSKHVTLTMHKMYRFMSSRKFYPLKPHFYIVKLGFTGVYIIFLIFARKNIDCGHSLEPPR